SGDEEADDGIGKRIAKPHADGAEQHRQASPAVDTGVVAVRDQRGAVDLAADADAENRDRFVAKEADDRGGDHRPQVRDLLGMQEPRDALVSRDDGARENRDDNGYTGQILDAAVPEREPLARPLARKPERDREWDGGGGIAEIVDGIREQR